MYFHWAVEKTHHSIRFHMKYVCMYVRLPLPMRLLASKYTYIETSEKNLSVFSA